MNKLLLLFVTLIIGLLFLVIPTTEPKDFFIFSDMKLSFQMHLYFICEKIILIILAWIIAAEDRHYRNALKIFFWLLVADLLDYCLSYNAIWFNIGWLPVSMNIVKIFIFGSIIAKEWIKDPSQI